MKNKFNEIKKFFSNKDFKVEHQKEINLLIIKKELDEFFIEILVQEIEDKKVFDVDIEISKSKLEKYNQSFVIRSDQRFSDNITVDNIKTVINNMTEIANSLPILL